MKFFFKTRQAARDFKTRSGNKNPVIKEQKITNVLDGL